MPVVAAIREPGGAEEAVLLSLVGSGGLLRQLTVIGRPSMWQHGRSRKQKLRSGKSLGRPLRRSIGRPRRNSRKKFSPQGGGALTYR